MGRDEHCLSLHLQKKELMKKQIILLLLILLGISLLPAKAVPAWVKKEPVDPAFFSSVITIDKKTANYKDKARDAALKNIAMQITVTVSANLSSIDSEISNTVRSEFISKINTSTTAKLANIELADSYENKKQYWVYYRLNKEQYYLQRRQSRDQAISYVLHSLDKIDSGESNLNESILLLLEGLDKITEFIEMDLETELKGRQINIYNEILIRLRRTIAGIKLSVDKPDIRMTSYLNKALVLNIALGMESSTTFVGSNLSNVPLTLKFDKGKGKITSRKVTDEDGICPLTIERILSAEPQQALSIALDKSYYLKFVNNILTKDTVDKIQFPYLRLGLSIDKPSVLLLYSVDGKEDKTGYSLIYDKCVDWSLDPVTDPAKADYIIEIKLQTREGSYMAQFNQNSYFAEALISLREKNSKASLYSNTISQIKGSDRSMENARLKAISNAGITISNEELSKIFLSYIFNE